MIYTADGLHEAHFKGFIPFSTLVRKDILGPRGNLDVEGIYAVVRRNGGRPLFIDDDHPNPRGPVAVTQRVASRWIDGAEILYFGKAPRSPHTGHGLANRLLQYQRCGLKGGSGHFGGRLIWRLQDRNDLLICWKKLPERTAGDVEALLLSGFQRENQNRLPFANLNRGKRNPDFRRLPLLTAP